MINVNPMTKQELNRDVSKLYKEFDKYFKMLDKSKWYDFIQSKRFKDEFIRLHGEDKTMNSLSRLSLHKMITMQRITRVIPFHVLLQHITV